MKHLLETLAIAFTVLLSGAAYAACPTVTASLNQATTIENLVATVNCLAGQAPSSGGFTVESFVFNKQQEHTYKNVAFAILYLAPHGGVFVGAGHVAGITTLDNPDVGEREGCKLSIGKSDSQGNNSVLAYCDGDTKATAFIVHQ